MRVHICAVGRLRSGPERDLIDDYLKRFDRTGRALGLGPVSVHEVEDKKGLYTLPIDAEEVGEPKTGFAERYRRCAEGNSDRA